MALTEQELRTLDYEPDAGGHFGDYGGRYVSETLMAALSELDQNYQKLKNDPDFQREFDAFEEFDELDEFEEFDEPDTFNELDEFDGLNELPSGA